PGYGRTSIAGNVGRHANSAVRAAAAPPGDVRTLWPATSQHSVAGPPNCRAEFRSGAADHTDQGSARTGAAAAEPGARRQGQWRTLRRSIEQRPAIATG